MSFRIVLASNASGERREARRKESRARPSVRPSVRPSHALTKLPAVTIIISGSAAAAAEFDRGSIFGRAKETTTREGEIL